MDKTLAIALGGVTVVGLGLFAYLKLRKTPIASGLQAATSTSAATTPTASTNGGVSTITDTKKQEAENKEKELKQQLLSRPESLSDVQAVAYAVAYPESLSGLKIDVLLRQGGMGILLLRQIYEKDKPIEASKSYWKSTGRPKGHTVRILSNSDNTPITLNDDQAIIYLGTYPQIRKSLGLNLDKAKDNWVKEGRAAGRKIDLY
jgi:hypothetical protein